MSTHHYPSTLDAQEGTVVVDYKPEQREATPCLRGERADPLPLAQRAKRRDEEGGDDAFCHHEEYGIDL